MTVVTGKRHIFEYYNHALSRHMPARQGREIMHSLRDNITGLDGAVPGVGGSKPYINFDNAASTPPLKQVVSAVQDYLPWYSSIHRGSGFKSRLSTQVYEEARRIVGAFVGADSLEYTVLFGKNTTEAINKLAYRIGFSKRDVVLVSKAEHHSNDLPWRAHATVRHIGVTPAGAIDTADFERLLAKYQGRVKLVAITGASNVTGHLPDIHWFARQAHLAGAQIFVDCAQLAAHRTIRMGRLTDPDHLDYIALSAHKMYAPFGTGALIGRRDTFTQGVPEYVGGGTIDFVTTDQVDWAPPPERDEAGSPNVVGAVAMARAALVLQTIGMQHIARHEMELTAYALDKLGRIPGVTLYGSTKSEQVHARSAVIPFAVDGMPHGLVAAVLGYEWGIGVRSGCFCAQPYVSSLLGLLPKQLATVRHDLAQHRRDRLPGLVRVSFGMYNTTDEVDKLAQALTAIMNGEHVKYVQNRATGEFTPAGYHEDVRSVFAL